ncbi:hypothetical protein [Haloechinothrix sp. LS1_15]|uniref:hypothetical protein n=1 Tax=Haloechinothrix sp. LS1_15 TaxID=2652248 RepID=UPI0029479DB5|nr:hypothetical protein [Haloechinothrix sp. LS1_15]MDV6013817.1 hypothetical protein [Haloechinothrix sp. LS1_15]
MRLFGKGKKAQSFDPQLEFATTPIPRQSGPPASSTPLADYLQQGGPGVTDGYVVLPRSLVEQMPIPWQQQITNLLAQFHNEHRRLSWPEYRVLPSRRERLTDLDEEQLAEAGYLVELDAEGELVYRERNGRVVADPEATTVPVTCLDPIARRVAPQRREPSPRAGGPAPMNVGPEPVWEPQREGRRPEQQEGRHAAGWRPDDWFVDTAEETAEPSAGTSADAGEQHQGESTPREEATDFGPTGEPIERPFRFRE